MAQNDIAVIRVRQNGDVVINTNKFGIAQGPGHLYHEAIAWSRDEMQTLAEDLGSPYAPIPASEYTYYDLLALTFDYLVHDPEAREQRAADLADVNPSDGGREFAGGR